MNQKLLDNKVHQALTARVKARICEIGNSTGNIIKYEGKVYIVTCRHVADYFFKYDKSYIPLKDGNRIPFNQLKYCAWTNLDLDIALIEVLDKNLIHDYYEVQDFDIIDDFGRYNFSEINLFICGFPEQLSIKEGTTKKIIYFSYGANISNDKPSNVDYIYLNYLKESVTTEGLLTKLPKAPGLSGSFILKAETFKGKQTDIWDPSFAKIIAIQIAWNEKNWLKATNIKHLFELLKKNKST